MSEPIKKANQKPESYRPGEKPEIIEAAMEKAESKYQRYKDIEFYVERVSFPETLKIAGVPWQENFGNIGDYHKNYRDTLSVKFEPYTDAEIFFCSKDYGIYIFGGRVTSIEGLPNGMIGIDTGYTDFDVLTFRAADLNTLLGDEKEAGDAMKTAGEYTKEVWFPQHLDETDMYNAEQMQYKMKINEADYGCSAIGIYRNTSNENPEMCHFLPLRANRKPGKIIEYKKEG